MRKEVTKIIKESKKYGWVMEPQAKKILRLCGLPTTRFHWVNHSRELLKKARDIGYPDLPGLVLRAMSLRLTHREAWDSTRRRRSNTVLAFCLAYVDADTARWLIEPLVEPFLREQLDTYVAGHSLRNQVMVYALASLDPARAAEAVLAMPDDKPDRADGRKGARRRAAHAR